MVQLITEDEYKNVDACQPLQSANPEQISGCDAGGFCISKIPTYYFFIKHSLSFGYNKCRSQLEES